VNDLPLLFKDVARWYAVTAVALGIRTGLTDSLLAGGGTADELAKSAGVDADNAARWADAMVVGGYATSANGRYEPAGDALELLGGGFVFDVRAIVEILVPLGGLLPRVEIAMRNGRGISSAEFQSALGMTVARVNVPMYRSLLVSEWIAGHPDLEAALRRGIDVAEIGPGDGMALRLLAGAFPASRFVGFDIDAPAVAEANAIAAGDALGNVRFEVADGNALPPASVDLACIFDAFHHLTDPAGVLDSVHRALRPAGSLLLAEAALSGIAATDADDPSASIVYGSDLLYCYQESKVAGKSGLGSTWPGRGLAAMLVEHGFDEVSRVESQAGYVVIRAVLATPA
jgi:SAM-dependent methyltransferase